MTTVNPTPGAPAADADPAALPAVLADGRVNILIVDDEPANLRVLEAILDDPGYRLVRALNANEALLALVAEDFGLLILDIRMPDMSGFELAQLIKQRKKSASVPIIFLTAFYNEDQDVVAGYGTGAVDYLHKPVNATVLRSKVAVFVELHRKSRELAMANRALMLEVAERRRAEEQLRELNESLDRRVTERSEALRESEQRFRTMADQTPVMMWVASPAGAVDFVNKEYGVFFGVIARGGDAQRLAPAACTTTTSSYRPGAVRGAAHAAAVPGRSPHAARRRRMALDDVAGRAAHLVVGRVPRHDRHEPGRHRPAAGGDHPAADRAGQGRVHRRPRPRAAQPARAHPHLGRHPARARDASDGRPFRRGHRAADRAHGAAARRPARHVAAVAQHADAAAVAAAARRRPPGGGGDRQPAGRAAAARTGGERHRRAGVARRRPGAAHAGVRQPAQQRRQVQQARRPRRRRGAPGGRAGSRSACATPASASRPTCWSACSNPSRRRPWRATTRRAASASACRWRTASSRCTAAPFKR